MSKNLPIGEAFGNYLLKGISEISQPEPLSWMPVAPGFRIIGAILGVVLFWVLFRLFCRWRKNAYRRHALSKIHRLQKKEGENIIALLEALPGILKHTALCAYPRSTVASLTGRRWLDFLESHCPGSRFTQATGQNLITIAYQDPQKWCISYQQAAELTAMVRNWVKRHQVGDIHA